MLSEYLLLRSKSDVNYNPSFIAGFILILIGFKWKLLLLLLSVLKLWVIFFEGTFSSVNLDYEVEKLI